MNPMLESRYVGWMAVRPLTFGDEEFAPGDRIPQKHLETMRDPEVLLRTGQIAAVAKDMNKVPVMLRKDVTEEEEMRAKILNPRFASQVGHVMPNELVGTVHDPSTEAYAQAQETKVAADKEAASLDGSGPGFNPDKGPQGTDAAPIPPSPASVPSIATVGPDGEVQNAQEETAPLPPAEDAPEDVPEAAPAPAEVPEPAQNASTEEWAAYAKSKGATEEDVDGKNRSELITEHGTPKEG